MWKSFGRKQKVGLLLLVVFLLGSLGSLQAEVTLTDDEWTRIQQLVQQITQENSQQKQLIATLQSQLSDMKMQHEKEQQEWTAALEAQKAQLSLLQTQLGIYREQLTNSIALSKKLTTDNAILGVSLIASGGLSLYLGLRSK